MTVQIGSQADVPAPGDPIVSPWHQDTASKLVHRFTSTSDRDAKWPLASVPRGAVCITIDTDTLWQKGATAWLNVTGLWVAAGQIVSNVSGSAVAAYRKTGNLVHWSGMWTGAALAAPIATAPFTFTSRSLYWVGSVLYRSTGVAFKIGACYNTDDGTGLQFAHNEAAGGGIVGATAPFTWKAGDQCSWHITYETAP